MTNHAKQRIVIVGGGAGGLELATRLARIKAFNVCLVDANLTHLWKPILHEVAVGTLNSYEDEINYFSHASSHGFEFEYGRLIGLDRAHKQIILEAIKDGGGDLELPERRMSYDTLVIAVGSVSNDFNLAGVNEHCFFLDNLQQANNFHKHLLNQWLSLQQRPSEESDLNIVIIGGGATGIELAAELRLASQQIMHYGLDKARLGHRMKIHIIESSKRLMPVLPEHISKKLLKQLKELQIDVHLDEYVTEVTADSVTTKSGLNIPCTIKVWAAGIKAPDVLANLDGLEVNQRNQIKVHPTLQSISDEAIFVIGDCANCICEGQENPVPPRAQSAHQQASLLAKSFYRHFIKKQPLIRYQYKDYGSLISLCNTAVGQLMGKSIGQFMIEGRIARLVYVSLYRSHLMAIHGFWRTSLLTLANWLTRRVKPRLKLH